LSAGRPESTRLRYTRGAWDVGLMNWMWFGSFQIVK
jgi:hypothetical protein